MAEFTEALHWRYATKKFDSTKKLSKEQVTHLLEAARLAPTSYGLMPTRITVVQDTALREKLRKAAYDQSQITDSSHLVVFQARRQMDAPFIDAFIDSAAKTRGLPVNALEGYRKMIHGTFAAKSDSPETQAWTKRQTYICLGFLLFAAAQAHIDVCPMEGFDSSQFDHILGLDKTPYTSVVLAALGHRSPQDDLQKAKKVRPATNEFIEWR
jgi:nitroreductase